MKNDIKNVLLTEEEIRLKVKELGQKISNDYKGKSLLLICLLKGSAIFLADLCRAIDLPIRLEFMQVSSYGNGTENTKNITIKQDISQIPADSNIVIVEDILDTGRTLYYIRKYLMLKNPASLEICTLLDKPSRRLVSVDAKYVGFEVPDEFVVGYGLDFAEKYRNLPYIGVLRPEVYENN